MIDYTDYFRKDGTQDRELIEMLDKAYQQGRADVLMPYDVESIEELIENVKSKARVDAIDEALQIIHNIYAQDLHCIADMCDRDNQGYDCEDCLYKSINQNLEQLKENKNE